MISGDLFFVDDESGAIYFNEINTLPGFTSISMYPKLWVASGLSYSTLLDKLIKLAFERHEKSSPKVPCHFQTVDGKNRNRVSKHPFLFL